LELDGRDRIREAIELLIAAPVRPQNLASIRLSRHLIRGHDGARKSVHLFFPANEVKNDVDLEFRLPPRVVEMLNVYLAKARRLLAEEDNDYLFPGRGLGHYKTGHLSERIAETAERVTGVRVTGHQFRHLVGFLYLKDNPGGHEVVRRFLGHKSIETTLTFYAGMEQAAAISLWDRHIEERRQRIVQQRPKRRKSPRQERSRNQGEAR
jgi:integrase